ncbi:MAG: hypothetical protein GAK29_04243 [Acinetobacter bereziniae]|uniref:Uncharacterized protein n=1 Tax=Acinetobacter bereziniae TaxID=106648 RepID=A0A833PBR8_ACIBZ|nr:MAG: hypothetical protein GAK29_04243 [Acinetobacter bereziniae]
MFEKLEEWMNFHTAVMKQYPRPGFLMIFSCIVALVVSWFYPKIVMGIANFEIGGHAPYQDFIFSHIRYFRLGMWVVPFLIFIVLMSISWGIHKENIKKYFR